ncbi:protocatechuate 3,4-dioxygenase subunit alpha [Litoreibacter roseus]|uniref:Protocatechuate 3,4-dioxygenase subunit alpha n=1 Tax=Litoreibacter roseus TaxID=2601869 RepID=A0A6N6JAG3_9RHOB|nr:protocatechuate 3,4-dioxygenase subunit alpha [Litoreibacter roseus]GFE63221.1 protocatechuate 3,4-dioxygenase subunit alpha [Litoreibacter roseus]
MSADLKESPSQTAGPYVHIGCVPSFAGLEGMYRGRDLGAQMIRDGVVGERITIQGRIFDGAGEASKDAMVEIWQADSAGRFNSPGDTGEASDPSFSGWGRQPTDGETGLFRFETIKPGAVPWNDGRQQAPHISVWVVARGINLGLHTRIYFSDEAANADDPLLSMISDTARRSTLVANRSGDTFHFDIHLQGEKETVFFDV